MGTKMSRQYHRTALARDNIPRIANQEVQNFNEIFSSTTAEISLEQEKSHNHLATKKHRHDPSIQKEALIIRKSQSIGNLASATLVFTDQQLLNDQKKQTHRNKASSSQNSSRIHSDSTTSFDQISSSKLKRKKIPYNSQLDFIDSKDLKYVREIGKGNFGTVHHALYKDENPNRSSIFNDDEYMYIVRQQASVMIRLRHANLLRIIGVTFFESQQSSWITDFMRNGSLLDYFEKHRDIFLKSNSYYVSKQLNSFGRQIYEAMLYLEERHIIHQKLAARNCLIDEDDTLKVADVGVPHLTEIGSCEGTYRPTYALHWTAPEVLFLSQYSSRSDVWSYGITLWEIYSLGERPFGNMTNDALQIVLKNPSEILSRYLPKPRHCGSDETYTHVILPCLTNSVTMRPRFRDLKQRILDILVNEI
ncbi:unnamed protein product [Adineta steineri]|uniref:Protein kinase domain-containing protein n=1 Tax=Adineta steineri TaxID=433720 RepID=A0A814N4R5_9BILA|nr:unnamed protein product [Adineta steineri]CAF4170233.1 unnamed protein product [Adineta steineri]